MDPLALRVAAKYQDTLTRPRPDNLRPWVGYLRTINDGQTHHVENQVLMILEKWGLIGPEGQGWKLTPDGKAALTTRWPASDMAKWLVKHR